MSSIDVNSLTQQMTNYAVAEFEKLSTRAAELAQASIPNIAEVIASIEIEHAAGRMNETQARHALAMTRNALDNTIIAGTELTQIMVQNVLNKALLLISDTVNTALGFILI